MVYWYVVICNIALKIHFIDCVFKIKEYRLAVCRL